MVMATGASGYLRFPADRRSLTWAQAALPLAKSVAEDPGHRRAHLRHGATWFVGVDALTTERYGALGDTALDGPWRGLLPATAPWPKAQLSIVYPGYPGRDPGETDAAHRYRRVRDAAHVDGLLPVGPARRRFPREFHAFVLAVGLSGGGAAPTVCWEGSHILIGRALRAAIGRAPPHSVDVTDAYHAARREAFDVCRRVEAPLAPGESLLLHRFTLHGTAPWRDGATPNADRMVAFFRPEYARARDWVEAP